MSFHAGSSMEALAEALARVAAADARSTPWFVPYRAAALRVAPQLRSGEPLASALNSVLAQQPTVALNAAPLRFAESVELPPGESYEAFIARTARVPTRDNLHDLFNALVWLTFPALKRRLNELQAAQITVNGVGNTRGALRDALTLFDENGALWPAPLPLAQALSQRDWPALFITHRTLWRGAEPLLFGHALLEKLLQPRKPITAHVWLLPPAEGGVASLEVSALAWLTPQHLASTNRFPLPVLGVPRWWPANEVPGFYDDASVFRAAQG